MPASDFAIKPTTRSASNSAAALYHSPEHFAQMREHIFAKSWQCIGMKSHVDQPGIAQPFLLMEGLLDEPLLLVCDAQGQLRCLSNVCTHCGNLLVHERSTIESLICSHDGRTFNLRGNCTRQSQSEEQAGNESDRLPELPLHQLGDLLFTGLFPEQSFDSWIQPVLDRVGEMPLDALQHAADFSRNYQFQANWLLYLDHLLGQESGSTSQQFPAGNLRIRPASDYGEPALDLPTGHPDHGKTIAAYHFYLFPNLLLDIYPWGIVLGILDPLSPTETQLRSESFLWNPELLNPLLADALHHAELERGLIIETQQRGVQSRLFQGKIFPEGSLQAQLHEML